MLKVFQVAGSLSFKHFCDHSITHTHLSSHHPPGRYGGGLLSAGGVPAVWRSVTPALSRFCPQRHQTGERLPVRLSLPLGQTRRLWHGQYTTQCIAPLSEDGF